jgi:hypothetical protein
MRSRDFYAGPVRTTRHFFSSSEFIKGDVVAAFDRSFTATDGRQLRRCRSFLGNSADSEVMPKGFHDEIGRLPPLFPGGSIYPPAHRRWNLNRILSLAHS